MAAPWYQVADWPDELARWIWSKGPGRVNENAITYYFAVYNAATAGTATMWFTADNWAELSVNDVVIATSLDRTVTYNATFNLTQGPNVIQFKGAKRRRVAPAPVFGAGTQGLSLA